MRWQQIREIHTNQWLLVEAIQAHTQADRRVVEDWAVIDIFADARAALGSYVAYHERLPQRELYVVHTDRESLEIIQRRWVGIRPRGNT